MATVRNLFTKVSMDASDFSAGAQKVRSELISLNKSFAQNKAAMAETAQEIKGLEKQQKDLDAVIKSGTATKEQKTQYKDLSDRIDNARTKMAQLKTTEQDLKSKTSAATSELKKMNTGMRDSATSTESAKKSLSGLGTVLKTLVAGYTGKKLYDWLIGSNAEMEQYVTSFSVMLGSAEKAQSMINSMTEFAAKTPLELTDIVSSGQLLMNYGVAAEDLIPTMQKLGDLAGGNAEKLNRVAMAYGQMLAKGKVSGEELRQMTEAGVPLLQTLADTMGKTTAEVQDMTSKGAVGISDLNNAITALTTGGGKFAGLMEAQSHTMNGMLSTLKDNFDQMGRDIGEGAFAEIKGSLEDVMTMIKKASEDGTLKKIGEDAGQIIKTIVTLITGAIKTLYDMKDVLIAAAAAFVAFKVATAVAAAIEVFRSATARATIAQWAMNAAANANPYVLLATALVGVGTAIFAFASNAEKATDKVQKFNDALDEAHQQAEDITKNGESEIAMLRHQEKEYEALRTKVNLTASEKARLKELAGTLQEALGDEVQVIDKQTGAYNDLSESIDIYLKKLHARIQAEAMEKEASAALTQQEELQTVYDDAKTEYEALKSQFEKAKSELVVDESGWAVDDTVAQNVAYLGTAMKDAKDKFNAAKDAVDRNNGVIEKYDGLALNAAGATDKLCNSESSTAAETQDMAEAYETACNAFELYNSVQSEVQQSGSLTISTLKKITEQYPQMTDAVNAYLRGQLNETQVVNELAKCYQVDADNYYSVVTAKMANDTKLYNAMISGNASLVNGFKSQYGIDLTNYKSYAQAKLEIEKQLQKQRLTVIAQAAILAAPMTGTNAVQIAALKGAATAAISQAQSKISSYQMALGSLSASFVTASGAASVKSPSFSKANTSTSVGNSSASGSSGGVGSASKTEANTEISIYEKANAAYKKLVDDRIALIEKEKDAKKDALDASLDAVDKEIEARKRLNDDKYTQKEIDALNAQLKYAQMDDFSRMELEKQRDALLKDQAETEWERQKQSEKEALQESYNTAVDGADATISKLQEAMNYASNLFTSLQGGAQSVSSIINNNSNSANVSIVNQALSAAQIAKAIKDMLWDGV